MRYAHPAERGRYRNALAAINASIIHFDCRPHSVVAPNGESAGSLSELRGRYDPANSPFDLHAHDGMRMVAGVRSRKHQRAVPGYAFRSAHDRILFSLLPGGKELF